MAWQSARALLVGARAILVGGAVTPIYLDYNATTPVDPQVLEAMLPFLRGEFGNPSSAYALGRRAHGAVERARAEVAQLIGAEPEEIVFTGSATEASNLAIRGAVGNGRSAKRRRHHQYRAPCDGYQLRSSRANGPYRASRAGRNQRHRLDRANDGGDRRSDRARHRHPRPERDRDCSACAEIARIAKARGALIHTDAAQSVGKIPVNVQELGVDLLTIAGHKLYAPKGIGALYVRKGVKLPPLVVGAGQEHGLRPGTENVAFIVGLGAACALAARTLERSRATVAKLSAALLSLLERDVPGLTLVGDAERRLPNTLNVLFPHVSGRQVLEACPRVMASTGSACHADSEEPSAILTALGIPRDAALGAVRLSLGRTTTGADVEAAACDLAGAWRRVGGQR